jgi:hypothetical protein
MVLTPGTWTPYRTLALAKDLDFNVFSKARPANVMGITSAVVIPTVIIFAMIPCFVSGPAIANGFEADWAR